MYYVVKVERRWWQWRPWGGWRKVKKRINLHKIIASTGPGDLVKKAARITHDGRTYNVDSWEYDFDHECWRAWIDPKIIMSFFSDLEQHEAEDLRDKLLSDKFSSWQRGQLALTAGDSYRALEAAG